MTKKIKENSDDALSKLFKDFNGDPKDYKVEIDWGTPVGNEIIE